MAKRVQKRKPGTADKLKQETEQKPSVIAVVKDERTHKITGFLLVLLGVLLFLALASYCFTWQQDQDKVLKAGASFLFVENLRVDNLLGRLGAWTSHHLIYNSFGIASFLWCTPLLVLGTNLLLGQRKYSLLRNAKYLITGLVAISTTLGFLLPNTSFAFAGAFGLETSRYFTSLIGYAGTGFLLLFVWAGWFIWRFNPVIKAPKWPQKALATTQEEQAEEDTKPSVPATNTKASKEEALPMPATQPREAEKTEAAIDAVAVPAGVKSINELYAEGQQHLLQTTSGNMLETPVLEQQTVAGSGNSLEPGVSATPSGVAVVMPKPGPATQPDPMVQFDVIIGPEVEESAVANSTPMANTTAETTAIAPALQPVTTPVVPALEPQPAAVAPAAAGPATPKIAPIAVREIKPPTPPANLELEIKPGVEEDLPAFEQEEVPASIADTAPIPAPAMPAANAKTPPASRPATPVEMEPYDPELDLPGYQFPHLDLLETHGSERVVADPTELEENKNQIISTLKNYDITIQRISATVGPTVTLYEIVPAPGVRISRIKNLEDDIALSLAALGIRIIAPIPGKGTIGIEVPNVRKTLVSMRSLLASEKYQHSKFSLPIAIGKKIDNEHFVVDLAGMPHLLMAGATGQGKSVGINAVLVSLLYKKHPSQLKLVLVDPKKVELSLYRVIEKHFLAKLPGEEESIITDTKKVVHTLNALCIEMDNRYDLLKEAGVRNIREYNEKFIKRRLNPQKGHQYLPFIVLVVDEFADLIMTAGKEVEMPIARLAQLARAVGIHLIIATQRPSVNIITGTIKANFPSRVAFKVSSKIDSRTILDAGGAEQLIGKGDMLISHNGELIRLQCAFVDTPEVERICDFIGEQRGYPEAFRLPEYVDEKDMDSKDFDLADRDPMFAEAARLIVQNQMGSTSLIQRRMKLGYNRAGRLMDQLEAAGIVGPTQGSKAREVLVRSEMDLEELLGQW